jgi:benzil reductase ((S)-benzoin forming)
MERAIAGRSFGKAVLVNNAGVVAPVGPLDAVDARELERNIAVNVTAPLLLMRRFLRATASVPLRRVINISSGAGRRPIFGWSAYCAAKAALDMASRVAALEAQARGQPVHVVSLAPGVIDTPMQAVVRGASVEAFADVERFRKMKEEGVLRPADDVARDILALEAAGRLDGVEAVQDLRELGA